MPTLLDREAEDLLYFAQRGAEKEYQLSKLISQTRGMGDLDPRRIPIIETAAIVRNKLDIARSDVDEIIERYAGKVAIVAPVSHVHPSRVSDNMEDIITIEGAITKVDYKKVLFRVATGSGTVDVQYANFVLADGCTEPTPQAAIELEILLG